MSQESRPVAAPSPNDEGERRILRRVMLAAAPAAVCVWLLLPNVGPIFRLYSNPASSMAPALPVGSYALVSRLAYGYSRHSFDLFQLPIATGRVLGSLPARGDIVVFRLMRAPEIQYIKRVIGLPGEEIVLRAGVVSIDGNEIPRRSLGDRAVSDGTGAARTLKAYEETLPEGRTVVVLDAGPNEPYDNAGPFKVPEGHLFVLGDNRDNSIDSRSMAGGYGVGFVPIEMVVGKVVWVVGGG